MTSDLVDLLEKLQLSDMQKALLRPGTVDFEILERSMAQESKKDHEARPQQAEQQIPVQMLVDAAPSQQSSSHDHSTKGGPNAQQQIPVQMQVDAAPKQSSNDDHSTKGGPNVQMLVDATPKQSNNDHSTEVGPQAQQQIPVQMQVDAAPSQQPNPQSSGPAGSSITANAMPPPSGPPKREPQQEPEPSEGTDTESLLDEAEKQIQAI